VTFTVVAGRDTQLYLCYQWTLATILGVQTLTFTIPSPRAPVISVVTVTNTSTTAPLQITEEV